jgi:hypothetical protein
MKRQAIGVVLGMLGFVLVAPAAQAAILDLTTDGSSGFVGDGFYQQTDPFATGTGNIAPFVQIGDATPGGLVVEAYNTTANNVLDNKSSDTFNHELLLTDVPIISLDPDGDTTFEDFREFLLDINQVKNVNPSLLSLDEIQVFLSNTANQSVETFTSGVLNLTDDLLIYRLDDTDLDGTVSDNWIRLNYSLNRGSGSGDMFMYLPDDLFDSSYDFVYLYSRFGENIANNDGFEEWAVRIVPSEPPCTPETCPPPPPVIPEPGSAFLFGSGLLGALGLGSRSRRTRG